MFVKIGRLINLYFIIIIIVIHKNAKKHYRYIHIAFHNFKIKCTKNQTSVVSGLL